MDLLKFLIKCVCCVATTGVKVAIGTKSTYDSLCCLPCKCVVELKNCYNHCTAEVGVENNTNDVEVAGAAPTNI